MKDQGKRKRTGSMAKPEIISRPGKVPKHKRTWSMSSASSTGNRGSHEDDLQLKLAALQDMFTSTRPASVLFLRGEEGDDPDLHPVQLPGDSQGPSLARVQTGDSATWEQQSGVVSTSSIVSPTPSNQSLPSEQRRESEFSMPAHPPFQASQTWPQNAPVQGEHSRQGSSFSPPSVAVKVPKARTEQTGTLSGWIEALGVDYTYQPPPERPIKPGLYFSPLFKLMN